MSSINLLKKFSINQGLNSFSPSNKVFQIVSDVQTTLESTFRNAVRYETVAGHRFALIMLTEPTYCAQCHGFIWGLWGFSCRSCKLISHIKCLQHIGDICVKETNQAHDKLSLGLSDSSHDHRFEKKVFVKPSMCDHCGTLICSYKTIYQGLQCVKCCMKVHYKCEEFVCFNCDKTRNSEKLTDRNSSESKSYIFNHKSKVKIEDFEILKLIGRGSFSKVYLARLNKDGSQEEFAIKVIKKTEPVIGSDPQSVISEMVALNLGREFPFLTIAHCCFQSEDRLYFVMEYVIGHDLLYHTRKNENLSEDRAKFYAAEIVLALIYLHSKQIIHRDVKSENVIIDRSGHCKLIDFGMSKELYKTEAGRTRTFCGTPYYISPEIILGRDYNYSVDWWSLGILLYEMLVGYPPFMADNEEDIYKQIVKDDHVIPKQRRLSHEAVSILNGLLAKEPDKRLGCQIIDGCDEAIKVHEFFKFTGMNSKDQWDALSRKQIEPPWKPDHYESSDDSQFEDDNILTPIDHSQLEKISQDEFKDFSFYGSLFRSLSRI